jgi:carbon storage regulator
MLILTRRRGERIIIGDIVITMLEINGNQARLGFEAPTEIVIHREEVHLKIKEQQHASD